MFVLYLIVVDKEFTSVSLQFVLRSFSSTRRACFAACFVFKSFWIGFGFGLFDTALIVSSLLLLRHLQTRHHRHLRFPSSFVSRCVLFITRPRRLQLTSSIHLVCFAAATCLHLHITHPLIVFQLAACRPSSLLWSTVCCLNFQ